MSEVTDEYLASLWGEIERGVKAKDAAEIVAQDVSVLIKEIWRLRTELAKAEGFNKGLQEGVEWLKRDNEAMRRLMSETN